MTDEEKKVEVQEPKQEEEAKDTKLYKDEVTGDMVSKNELKKRQNQRKKEAEAAKKA